jgi:predicted DNA binding CopG/RHH family protein
LKVIYIQVEDEFHERVKALASLEGMSMREYVTLLLEGKINDT